MRTIRHIDALDRQLLTDTLDLGIYGRISKIAIIAPLFAVIEYNEFKRFVNVFREALCLDANKVRIIAYGRYDLHRLLSSNGLFVCLQTIDARIIGDISTTAAEYAIEQRQDQLLRRHGILSITGDGTIQIEIRIALTAIGSV